MSQSERRVYTEFCSKLESRSLLKPNIYFDFVSFDEFVGTSGEKDGYKVEDPGEERNELGSVDDEAAGEVDRLHQHYPQPNGDDLVALPRLQSPDLVCPGHEGDADEEDEDGDEGRVHVL